MSDLSEQREDAPQFTYHCAFCSWTKVNPEPGEMEKHFWEMHPPKEER